MSFKNFNLDPLILKAIEKCGYTTPTPVQSAAIPSILEGKDVVVSAQTGTGKTASFVLPALQYVQQQGKSKQAHILILTPTRELATQITKAAALYGQNQRFNIVSLVGGMPYQRQINDLMRGADIIVATPGRLIDHIERKRIDLSKIQMFILDEADRMLDMGFIEDVEFIAKLLPKARQTLLFSATVNKKLMQVVQHLLKHPIRIDLSKEELTSAQIKQIAYKVKHLTHKTQLLKHILTNEQIFKAIIFSATKIHSDHLAQDLRHDGLAAAALHSDLSQSLRNRTMQDFRTGKIQFLIATDVAARGIDVHDITHVINFDLPRFSEDYVHRIGRTGRAGKEGIAISFVLPIIDGKHLQRIEKLIGQKIKLIQDKNAPETSEHDFSHKHREYSKPNKFQKKQSKPAHRKEVSNSFSKKRREKTSFRDDTPSFSAKRRDRNSSYKADESISFSQKKPARIKYREDNNDNAAHSKYFEKKKFKSSNKKMDGFTESHRKDKYPEKKFTDKPKTDKLKFDSPFKKSKKINTKFDQAYSSTKKSKDKRSKTNDPETRFASDKKSARKSSPIERIDRKNLDPRISFGPAKKGKRFNSAKGKPSRV